MKKHMDRLLALLLACALTIGDCVPALAAQPEAVQAVSEAETSEAEEAESEQSATEADAEADADEAESEDAEADEAEADKEEADEAEAKAQQENSQTTKAETYSGTASQSLSSNVLEAGNSYTLANGTEFQFTPEAEGYYYVKPSNEEKAVYMQVYETNTYDDGSVDSYYRPVYGDSILIDSAVQQAFSLKAGLTYNIDIHDYSGDSADTGFGFYKAETYQAANKLESDKSITISKDSFGLCEIEGESGTLYYIGFSKTVDTRDLSMDTSFGTSIQDGNTVWYPVILGDSKKFSFYFNDKLGNNSIIQSLTEDVQVTVKTDLDVVQKISEWPTEITVPAKATKTVLFTPSEAGDYLLPVAEDEDETSFDIVGRGYIQYEAADQTIYRGISVVGYELENHPKAHIVFKNNTDSEWTLNPITCWSDKITKTAVSVDQKVTVSANSNIYTFTAPKTGIYKLDINYTYGCENWIKNDQTGNYIYSHEEIPLAAGKKITFSVRQQGTEDGPAFTVSEVSNYSEVQGDSASIAPESYMTFSPSEDGKCYVLGDGNLLIYDSEADIWQYAGDICLNESGKYYINVKSGENYYFHNLSSSDTVTLTLDKPIASGTVTDNGSNITWSIDSNGCLRVDGTGDFRKTGYFIPWYNYTSDIKSAVVHVKGATTAAGMFMNCYNLETVDLSGFDTSTVTDMSNMFDMSDGEYSRLTDLDLSKLNTSNVTDMRQMFSGCTALRSLYMDNWDTRNVTDMREMFTDCESLDSLYISNFKTPKVTDMALMFSGCDSLQWLYIDGFDTSNVTDMSAMFAGCGELRTPDVSHFDTRKVTNMDAMFSGCKTITSLDLSSFTMGQVTKMRDFLSDCTLLEEIKAPVNPSAAITLPKAKSTDVWYQENGTIATTIPKGAAKSITYLKNEKPISENQTLTLQAGDTQVRMLTNGKWEQTIYCTPAQTGYYALESNFDINDVDWYEKTTNQRCQTSPMMKWEGEDSDYVYGEKYDYCHLEKGKTYKVVIDKEQRKWDTNLKFVYSKVAPPTATVLAKSSSVTLSAGKTGYYSVSMSRDETLFIGSTGSGVYAVDGNADVETNFNVGDYAWTEIKAHDDDQVIVIFSPSKEERTIVCTETLDDYFDGEHTLTDKNWSGTITLEPNETKTYHFSTDRVGDYLIKHQDGVSFSSMMEHNVETQELVKVDGESYDGFYVGYKAKRNEAVFMLINYSNEEQTVTLKTDANFTFNKITETDKEYDSTDSQIPYYQISMAANGAGFYRLVGDSGEVDPKWSRRSRKDADDIQINMEDMDYGLWLDTDDTVSFALENGDGSTFKVVPVTVETVSGEKFEVSGTDQKIYKYTPSVSGKLYVRGTAPYYYVPDRNAQGRYWSRFKYDTSDRAWIMDVTAGETYYLYIHTNEEETVTATLNQRSEITVLDYDYFNAFVKSQGSVTVNNDGKVEITKKAGGWKEQLKDFVMEMYENIQCTFQNAARFSPANYYWKVKDVGEFSAAEYYRLDKGTYDDKTSYEAKQITGETANAGDVVLVKYEPEIVWVQKMTLSTTKTQIEPKDTVQLTANLDYGQTVYKPKTASVIRWESLNPEVATVDPNTGVLTALTTGKVTIKAYADEALREQENRPESELVTATITLNIAWAAKNFTTVKWTSTSTQTVAAGAKKYYNFTTTTPGDYLFEIPDNTVVELEEKKDVTYRQIQFNGKNYACATFNGTKDAVYKFSIKNNNEGNITWTPLTQWDLCELDSSRLSDGKLGNAIALGTEAGATPSVYYYSYTASADGVYKVEPSTSGVVKLICKKDGKQLENLDAITLAKGEILYLMFEGEGTGENAASFTLNRDDSYIALTDVVDDQKIATLKSGTHYIYIPTQNSTYTATAFTSWYEKDAVASLQYTEGTTTADWKYDQATGNYTMPMTKGKIYLISYVKGTKGPDSIQISVPGYTYATKNTSFTLSNLTDKDLNGNGSAARVSAAKYGVSGLNITATGTQKYVRNFTGMLGTEAGTYKNGYFLAFRMKVQNAPFTEDGYIRLTYNGKTQTYRKTDLQPDTNKSYAYVDAYLDVTDLLDSADKTDPDLTTATIRVSTDDRNNVKTYTLNLSKLLKETETKVGGTVTEYANAFGIRSSAPVITQSEDGTETTVTYNSVSWSPAINLATEPTEENVTTGNYLAWKIAVPDSMDKMITKENVKVNFAFTESEKVDKSTYAYELSDDGSYLSVALKAEAAKNLQDQKFTVTWGSEGKTQITQTITVKFAENCYMEEIPETAALPKNIAFTGLVSTMYVGQTQNISTTITKKYEEDVTRLSYSSSDPSIFTVNRVTGEVQALKAGTAKITVEAIDADCNTVSRTANITVKNPLAPSSIKITDIKDTSVTVNWAKNITGQKIKVYAVPFEPEMGKNAAQWKAWIEAKLASEDEADKTVVASWQTGETVDPSTDVKVGITGLTAETKYIFYVCNQATNAAGETLSFGNISGQTATKKLIFDNIRLYAVNKFKTEGGMDGSDLLTPNDTTNITVKDGKVIATVEGQPVSRTFNVNVAFQLFGKGTTLSADTVFTNVSFKSSNTNVIRVGKSVTNAETKLAEAVLTLGGQAGTAQITVTGKDASGAVRTSEPITFTVEKTATKLKAKTTTLAIGQSIALKDLIAYDVTGVSDQVDTSNINFASVLDQLLETGSFVRADGATTEATKDTVVTAAALLKNAKGVPASGATTTVTFTLEYEEDDGATKNTSTSKATIKVNAMAVPVIKSTAPADTSAVIQFTPNATVRELDGNEYYYTVTVTDKVTGKATELRNQTEETAPGMSAVFAEASTSTAAKPAYTCTINGLSANKSYNVTISAHYDATGTAFTNVATSRAASFTTKKRLLASDGTIGVNYISLTDLSAKPKATGTKVSFDEGQVVTLENNETYVFMAQVSNLTRVLETDKLSWSISSGDRSAATIKATSSTFEAQLKAVRTGTFTVTAKSTVTKEALATFTVQIVPFQSGGKASSQETNEVSRPVAYLMTETPSPFKDDEKKTA